MGTKPFEVVLKEYYKNQVESINKNILLIDTHEYLELESENRWLKNIRNNPMGKEFIQSIENQTDAARLSRGKTYANTDKIYDVKISQNQVIAKSKGTTLHFIKQHSHLALFQKVIRK